MKLHGYYRSSAAYRVRIALHLKGLVWEDISIHLRQGAQQSPEYLALNPQGLVPMLADDDGGRLIQSLAIIEFLEECHPEPPLLPTTPTARARVRGLAQVIASDIHPLANLRVLKRLEAMGADDDERTRWICHWITTGFTALEALVADHPDTGHYCHGDTPGLADIALVPQMYNARRFGCELGAFPTLVRIDATCRAHPAFAAAAPENQPDAE